MGFFTLVMLAAGLSMDAFAVSVTNGICYPRGGRRTVWMSALFFGLFQGLMPAAGFLLGQGFASLIQNLDHWIALLLLGYIGGKMIWEAIKEMKDPGSCEIHEEACPSPRLLTGQAIATSIDALAVGVGFAAMGVDIVPAAALIGGITFLVCLAGGVLGRRFGLMLKQWAQLAGGIVLVAIGLKIFVEHMFF